MVNDEEASGQAIWHRFTDVIILDQQMRQTTDLAFQGLLSRARAAKLNGDDLAFLNARAISSILSPGMEYATTVVKLNAFRHHINLVQLEKFARNHCQKIYIFPALHTRVKSTRHCSLNAEDLLQQTDEGVRIPFPGLFLYTRHMPTILLTNVCTALGHVNGAQGAAIGVVIDPHGKSCHLLLLSHANNDSPAEFFELDDPYILCTRPPACVLFHRYNATHSTFPDLEPGIIPVFPLERSITIKGHSVRRTQVPMCPAFSLTDYKVQGSTLTTAVPDLKDDPLREEGIPTESTVLRMCNSHDFEHRPD